MQRGSAQEGAQQVRHLFRNCGAGAQRLPQFTWQPRLPLGTNHVPLPTIVGDPVGEHDTGSRQPPVIGVQNGDGLTATGPVPAQQNALDAHRWADQIGRLDTPWHVEEVVAWFPGHRCAP